MSKSPLIAMLVIFLISLLAPSAQAANHLPPTTVPFPAQQQDDNPRTAQLGENRGEVPEGSSEIWTYEGKAGDVLTIKAEADKPANDANPEERRQAGLLDMMQIVYAPDGTILAKGDDIQPGIVTDAVIEGLELPTDGTYKLEVLGLHKEGSGAYTLTLSADSATSPEPTPTAEPDWPTLTIENQLEDTICYVYIWPTSSDEVGDEWLGTKQVILPNSSHQWGTPPDKYNIVLSDCYGNTLDVRREFDVTEPSTLTVSPSATDGPEAQCAEGVQLFSDGKATEALPLLEAGFAGRESVTFGDSYDEGICAFVLGLLRDRTGNRSGALETYQVALDIFQTSGNRKLEGRALNHIGLVYDHQGKYDEALAEYKKALEITRQVDDHVGEAQSLNNIGLVYDHQGKYNEALAEYKKALEITRQASHRVGEGSTLNNIGLVYDHQGKYNEALVEYKKALEIRREIGDRAGEVSTLNNIATVYHKQGKYNEALYEFNVVLEIRRQIGDRAGEGTTLNNIAAVYRAQGKYDEALPEYRKALEIRREVGDRVGEGKTLNNIAVVYHKQGKYDEALAEYKRALEIRRQVDDRAGEGTTLHNIAVVYRAQGKYDEALAEYKKALEITRQVGDRAGEGKTLNNIAVIYSAQGKYDEALAEYKKALEIRREVGDRAGESTTLDNIAILYHNQGKYDEALAEFDSALEITRQIGDRAGEGTTLNNIASVYRTQGKYDEALAELDAALEITREVGNRAGEGVTLHNIGFVYQQKSQAEEALHHYEQAMELFEIVRARAGSDEERASFIAQYADLYHRAVGLYHQQGQDEEAFLTSERGRARSFFDSLATGYVQLSDDDLQVLIDRERDVYAQRFAIRDQLARVRAQNSPDGELVASLEARLKEAEEAYSKVQADIEARDDELAALVPGRSSVPTLSEIQALLDEETTLISYWVSSPELVEGLGEEGTLAFVMSRESLVVVELPEATPDNLLTALAEFNFNPSIDSPHPSSLQELHTWLVEPLAGHLNTAKVGIIPHQLLHYVPFAALSDGESYFGEQKVLFWLPSASALRFVQDKAREATETDSQGGLVFGNPTRDDVGFASLSHAAKEAETVAALLGTSHYTKSEATETQLRESVAGQKVVHLAAHGVYNSNVPLENTFIALAEDEEHDGLLKTREVYGLKLKGSQLVTLSACQTQMSGLLEADKVVSAGDEIVGLTRAFFFAGTPTVLSSLWNVDDAATGALMEAFYRNWESGYGKAEALAAAQAEVRANPLWASPYYWAGFVLSGDAGEITHFAPEATVTPSNEDTPSPVTTPPQSPSPIAELATPSPIATAPTEEESDDGGNNPCLTGILPLAVIVLAGLGRLRKRRKVSR